MSGDFSYLSCRAVAVAALLFLLAGCAAHRYTVCFEAGDSRYCRSGYRKHDARVAAETLSSLPGVDSASVERTRETRAAIRAPRGVTRAHDRQTKSGDLGNVD
jgi:hypothetical protein